MCYFGKNCFKSWNRFVSDKLVYLVQLIKADCKGGDRVGFVDGLSEYNWQLYIDLNAVSSQCLCASESGWRGGLKFSFPTLPHRTRKDGAPS